MYGRYTRATGVAEGDTLAGDPATCGSRPRERAT